MKICKKCNIEKELNEFSKDKKQKNGLSPKCKSCHKQYHQENKEKINQYSKQYQQDNKDKINQYNKQYYKDNKEQIKQYQQDNKDKINQYYQDNKDKLIQYSKQYQQDNKEKRKEYNKVYQKIYNKKCGKIRREKNPLFKLSCNLRSLIYKSLKNRGYSKNTKTQKMLGCSFEQFKSHLEKQFEPWMTWENYGKYNGELNYGWDIDHKIPTSSAGCETRLLMLNYYTNLQPLCSKVNRDIKRDKTDYYE